jgi:hypothetical protein
MYLIKTQDTIQTAACNKICLQGSTGNKICLQAVDPSRLQNAAPM